MTKKDFKIQFYKLYFLKDIFFIQFCYKNNLLELKVFRYNRIKIVDEDILK